jgi:hypothetical protein
MPQQQYIFSLHMSTEKFLRYYQGTVKAIQVVSECGKRLQFPASRMRPFLTHSGINGRFAIVIDQNQRFVNLRQI